MAYQLDLTAYLCPLPLLMAKKALQENEGQSIRILLNETVSLTDFELLGKDLGWEISLLSSTPLVIECNKQSNKRI